MKITIIDWVPGAGVTRWLRQIEKGNLTENDWHPIVVSDFADIALRNTDLRASNLSSALVHSCKRLADIMEAAESAGKNIVIGWSPVSYYAFAQLEGRILDADAIGKYTYTMGIISALSEAIVIKKPIQLNTDKLRIIKPNQLETLEGLLIAEYTRIMWASLHKTQRFDDKMFAS